VAVAEPLNGAEAFAREFVKALKELKVGTESYAAYLQKPASGDEADVVDRLFVGEVLLRALGYPQELRVYNRQKGPERPDWQVHLEGGGPLYFLVESKSTGEALQGHEEQLFRYMRRLGVPRGILTNGKEVLAYELREDVPLPLLAFSVEELLGVRQPSLFPDLLQSVLRTLYYRFHRDYRLSLKTVVDDLTLTVDGTPHAPDGSTWPDRARIQVIQAKGQGFAERFTQDLRDLLKAVREDARSQLSAWLRESEAVEAALWASPSGGGDLREYFEEKRKSLFAKLKELKEHFQQEDFSWIEDELKAPWEGRGAPWRGVAERVLAKLRSQVKARRGDRKWDRIRTSLNEIEKLATIYEDRWVLLKERHRNALAVKEAFEAWKARYGFLLEALGEKADPEGEYALQTAYVFLVRLLLVRIAEDKGLLQRRMFTDGGVAEWFIRVEPYYLGQGSDEGVATFLGMVFSRTQRDVYAHFFSEGTFDWYRPNRDLALRLLWRLAHYDFRDVDQDIIGYLYARYATEEHRHNTGMYYTPPEVVDYILERVGFSGREVVVKRLLDPACGSGTFLVRAARRILEAFKDPSGVIPEEKQDQALRAVLENLVGLDLNPFACYLAEINLLIQVVDLVKDLKGRGVEVHLDRFRVYNTDALIARFPSREWAKGFPEEEVKLTPENYDFVVGNPPYVRADAPGMKDYRELVRAYLPLKERVQEVLTGRWDLFVPFVALGLEWLREGGRLGMIVSRSVEEAPYAKRLRERLLRYKLLEVAHMNGRALFPDAVVDNTVLVVEKEEPAQQHKVKKRFFSGKPIGLPDKEEEYSPEGFPFEREKYLPPALSGKTVPLGDICYITSGMELQADEKRFPNEFKVEDLISNEKDSRHPRPYVDGSLVEPFSPKAIRWLEYGKGLRAPERVRGPRLPALWEREKLLLQRVLSRKRLEALWDRGQFGCCPNADQTTAAAKVFLTANHTATVAVRWCDLAGVAARQLGAVNDPERKRKEDLSRRFCLGYLVGILNTEAASKRFRFKESREGRVEADPDPLKEFPVPVADEKTQRRIARLALALEGVERRLRCLEGEGWRFASSPTPPVSVLSPGGGKVAHLSLAEVAWGLRVIHPSLKLRDLKREGNVLLAGRSPVLEIENPENARALEWFVWMERAGGLGEGKTWAELKDLFVPKLPENALEVLDRLEREREKLKWLFEKRERLLKELEERVEALYI
jgi:type I restriction-modification system DNA methylase subunit